MARTHYSYRLEAVRRYAMRYIDADRLPADLERDLRIVLRLARGPVDVRSVETLCKPYRKPYWGL